MKKLRLQRFNILIAFILSICWMLSSLASNSSCPEKDPKIELLSETIPKEDRGKYNSGFGLRTTGRTDAIDESGDPFQTNDEYPVFAAPAPYMIPAYTPDSMAISEQNKEESRPDNKNWPNSGFILWVLGEDNGE